MELFVPDGRGGTIVFMSLNNNFHEFMVKKED
jgi:hypothetical protein